MVVIRLQDQLFCLGHAEFVEPTDHQRSAISCRGPGAHEQSVRAMKAEARLIQRACQTVANTCRINIGSTDTRYEQQRAGAIATPRFCIDDGGIPVLSDQACNVESIADTASQTIELNGNDFCSPAFRTKVRKSIPAVVPYRPTKPNYTIGNGQIHRVARLW